jgi:F0F1-type ATP synthase delta subunit
MEPEALQIPSSLVSRVEAGRLARELETLDESIQELSHRRHNEDVAPSPLMQALVELNKLDLKDAKQRQRLAAFLKELKVAAPVVHMSFAAEPQVAFTTKIITWLRREVHPLVLLDIGLQPSIGAGCIIRTNSKYFDCSVRQHLITNRPKLLELMRKGQGA